MEEAGRKAVLSAGDLSEPAVCRRVVDDAAEALGGLDILVNNAAHQASVERPEDIPEAE